MNNQINNKKRQPNRNAPNHNVGFNPNRRINGPKKNNKPNGLNTASHKNIPTKQQTGIPNKLPNNQHNKPIGTKPITPPKPINSKPNTIGQPQHKPVNHKPNLPKPITNNNNNKNNLNPINLSNKTLNNQPNNKFNKNKKISNKNLKNKVTIPNTYDKNKNLTIVPIQTIDQQDIKGDLSQPSKLLVDNIVNENKTVEIQNVKVDLQNNTRENLPIESIEKNQFTLKELINLDVDIDDTEKVFVKGTMKYKITRQEVLNAIASGEWFDKSKKEIENILADTKVVKETSKNVEEINNLSITVDKEFENIETITTNQEINQPEYSQENVVENTNNNQANFSYVDKQENINTDNQQLVDNNNSTINKQQNVVFNPIPTTFNINDTWNKNLWRQEDILYKIYNITYNKNHEPEKQGYLNNVCLDIYPGDRIAFMSNDSISDSTLLDILINKIEKDSGYVFCNLKREQKWLDIHSNEYKGFDLETFNQKNKEMYQFNSPDYLVYANYKMDTIWSAFKKIFNAFKVKPNEIVFNELTKLLKLDEDKKVKINDLTDLHIRKINFICDVLFSKKVIVINNITNNLDVPQKLNFYRYINILFEKTDNVVLYNIQDIMEVKLFANRLVIIDNGDFVVNKRLKDILNTFETLDIFIVDVLDKLNKKYIEKR